jgi:hypothetical protein
MHVLPLIGSIPVKAIIIIFSIICVENSETILLNCMRHERKWKSKNK